LTHSNPAPRNRITRLYNRLQFGSALGLGVGFFFSFLIITGIFGSPPSRLADLFYQAPPVSGQVIIVALDHQSIQQIGEPPWQYTTLAQLVNRIADAQPRVLAFNVMLTAPATYDDTLAPALRRIPHVVQPIVGIEVTRTPLPKVPRFHVALTPTPALENPNTRLGHTLIAPDDDGVVRRLPLWIESNGTLYPAFGLAAVQAYLNQSANPLDVQRLPVDDRGQLVLNFFGASAQRTISAVDVLHGTVNLESLRDKIVLVGVTDPTLTRQFETPISLGTSASLIQADLIETLLTNRIPAPQERLTQIVMIFLLALLAGATLPHVRLLSAIGVTIIYFLLYVGYAFGEFNNQIIVQPIYPVLALGLMLIGTMVYRYLSEERHRAVITRLLQRYLAPEAVALTAEKFARDTLPLEGVWREVSVLAIDLSELEPLSSSLTPQATIRLLNDYVALMVRVVFEHEGAIVKHTGSALLAAWNLLADQPDHARTAVRTAIDIKHDIAEFNRRQPKELTIRVGMGIATGNVIAGKMGDPARAEYTIVGEIVGMAERIALKPERGVFIDVTTRERIGDEFDMIEVKPVRLRRKTDPAQVWLLVEPTETQEELTPIPIEVKE